MKRFKIKTMFQFSVFVLLLCIVAILGFTYISSTIFPKQFTMNGNNFNITINNYINIINSNNSEQCKPATKIEYYSMTTKRENNDVLWTQKGEWISDFKTNKPILICNNRLVR